MKEDWLAMSLVCYPTSWQSLPGASRSCHSWRRWRSDTLWQGFYCAHSGKIVFFFFLGQNWNYSYLQSVILWIYCCQSWASSWCLPTPGSINCSMYWLQYWCLCNSAILKSCAFQLFAQWGNFVINEPQIWCSEGISGGTDWLLCSDAAQRLVSMHSNCSCAIPISSSEAWQCT